MTEQNEIFGLGNWEIESCPDEYGTPLRRCRHKEVGEFLCTQEVIHDQIIKEEEGFKVFSLLWEHNLRNESVVLFSDEEAAKRYRQKVGSKFSVFSLLGFLRKFPKTVAEKQHRILMNMYRLNSTPGANRDIVKSCV